MRTGLLNSLLDRLINPAAPPESRALELARSRPLARPVPDSDRISTHTLETLRSYSSVLSHTLNAEPMLREFLLLMREIIGVNRAAIFLRHAAGVDQRIRCLRSRRGGFIQPAPSACPPACWNILELSLETGIGGYLFRSGRLLRGDSDEVARDPQMRREFDLLGAQVAIPMLDRETLVGRDGV